MFCFFTLSTPSSLTSLSLFLWVFGGHSPFRALFTILLYLDSTFQEIHLHSDRRFTSMQTGDSPPFRHKVIIDFFFLMSVTLQSTPALTNKDRASDTTSLFMPVLSALATWFCTVKQLGSPEQSSKFAPRFNRPYRAFLSHVGNGAYRIADSQKKSRHGSYQHT